jgi:Escherichia/Staphylococcus phage prohead protease
MPTPNESGRATFTVPISQIKFDASGDPEARGSWTMRGHAAVFNRTSHDMGGFRVKIAPGYFTKVLDGNPDVHLLWDHNTRYVLARTRNNSLELREDPMGLHVWARFAKTQTADELATLMDGGYIDQMSFATDVGESEWIEDSDGNITWHLLEADLNTGLTDVTVTAQGAFPQTDASLVASLKDAGALFASAKEAGHVIRREASDLVAAHKPGEEGNGIAQTESEGAADVADSHQARLAALTERVDARFAQHYAAE